MDTWLFTSQFFIIYTNKSDNICKHLVINFSVHVFKTADSNKGFFDIENKSKGVKTKDVKIKTSKPTNQIIKPNEEKLECINLFLIDIFNPICTFRKILKKNCLLKFIGYAYGNYSIPLWIWKIDLIK